MSKHDVLSREDIERIILSPVLLQQLEDFCNDNNLERANIKVLDYGSGRGASVACLRNLGYDAYGVEIDKIPYDNGQEYFQNAGYEHSELFHMISENCDTGFEDGFFDVVFSEQVFEHVLPISEVIKEICRITKDKGLHVHAFPAKYSLNEPHLHMPFVHWLPKNVLRRILMYVWIQLGKDPLWPEAEGLNNWQKAGAYFKYSSDKTYYRNISVYRKLYTDNSFRVYAKLNRIKNRSSLWGLLPQSVALKAVRQD